MIDGFEEYTKPLTVDEWKAVPVIVAMLNSTKGGAVVTGQQLSRTSGWAGTKGQSRVRHVIHVLRVTGEVPKLIASNRGYWIASSDDDVRIYIQSLEQRIAAITSVRNALRRQISDQRELPFTRKAGA
jgi:hypothetical protein